MTDKVIFPDWKEIVIFSEYGMQPQVLVETETYKSVVAGMAPGNAMPAHTEGPAIFHFLEGFGRMVVGEETLNVRAGATVIVPNRAKRGIEAVTQLAFLAVRLPE